MKTLLKLGILALVIVVFPTKTEAKRAVYGSGDIVKETVKVRGFDAIDVSSGFAVELIQSDKESVIIEADDNIIKYIEVDVIGRTLKIRSQSNLRRVKKKKVYIYFKNIENIDVSSGCSVYGKNRMKFDDLNIDASSGVRLDLDLTANEVMFDVSSGVSVKLKGFANRMEIDASSGTSLNAINFEVKKCSMDISSGCSVKVYATDYLSIDASSGSSIRYKGDPKLDLDISRSSSVRRY